MPHSTQAPDTASVDVVETDDLPDADAASDDAVVEPAEVVTGAPDGPVSRTRTTTTTTTGTLVREGDVAGDYLERLLDILDVDGDIDLDVEGDRASVAIVGGNLSTLIGPDGATLEALQELTRLAVAQDTGVRSRLMLDVGDSAPSGAPTSRHSPGRRRRAWPRAASLSGCRP